MSTARLLDSLSLIVCVLLILIGTEATECPNRCECSPDPVQPTSRLLQCNLAANTDLIPVGAHMKVPSNVRSLFITCNGSISLTSDYLSSLTGLHHLVFERCDISRLPSTLTKDLKSLRKLEFHEMAPNFELTEDVLEPLTRLEKLSVTMSPSVELPSTLLCLLPHLQVLNLSSNGLPTLRRDEKCVAQQLLIVDVSRNELENVEQFARGIPAVRELSIANNRFGVLTIGEQMPFLQHLDAEANKLEEISSVLPETLVNLNIARNRFAEIPLTVYRCPHLVALNISKNAVTSDNMTNFASNEIESIDASYNLLEEVPSIWFENSLQSISHVYLSNNNIAEMGSNIFENATNLQTLDVSSNNIQTMMRMFNGNGKLKVLKMANNSISKMEDDSLLELSLDLLDLSRNRLEEVPKAIEGMKRLKNLDVSFNSIGKLTPNSMKNVKDLHFLNISHNQIQALGPNTFSNCLNLHSLDASNNSISLIFNGAFSNSPKFRKVWLKNNQLSSIDEGLVEASNLRKIDISGNALVVLKWSSFPNSLESLIADNNKINLLTAATKSPIKNVSLKNNRISMISAEQIPPMIEQLDISDNSLSLMAKGTFAQKSQIRRIDLRGNEFQVIEMEMIKTMDSIHAVEVELARNPLECSCLMTWLLGEQKANMKPMRLVVKDRKEATCRHSMDSRLIQLDALKKDDMLCPYAQVCEPECICCQYGNCDCKSVCPNSCRCFHDENFDVNIVRCEQNETMVKREFVVSELPVSATEIILSGVLLPQLRTHSFIGRLRLKKLHINGTQLRAIQPKAFHTLPSLQTLDLSGNYLQSLTGDEFLKTPNILQLFLNGNRFRTLSRGIFEKLPILKFLTLHNNSLEDIPTSLTMIGSLSQISLSANPLRCDCSHQFRKTQMQMDRDLFSQNMEHNAVEWMSLYRNLVVDASKVECVENVTKSFLTNDTTVLSTFPTNYGKDMVVMMMDEFLREYNVSICVPYSSGFFGQEPQNSIIFIVLAISTSFIMFVFVVIGISMIRRSHDAINQRRYKASSLNCSTSAGSSPLPVPLLSYHGFVSYSKKDEKTVIDQLCRPLEDEDYQLCLLHRDGPAYNSDLHAISDELIAQMEASQCLILVLTRHFLDNEWKTLQIKTSHQLFAKNRSKRVIAVLGEGVDANLLDDELGQILRKHTLIEMKSHLFWTILHSALPSRLPLHATGSSNDDSSQVYSDIYGIVPSDIV